MIYGYIRPLYNDKNCEDQLKEIQLRCTVLFKESHGSPKKRVELERLLMEMKEGDTIIVSRMFALADTTRHLIELLKICEKDGVTVQFINEGITSLKSSSLLAMMDSFLQFQTDITKQTTIIGIAQAKEQGKTIGRPKKSDENVKRAISMYQSGDYTLLDIKNETGISKSTLYRYLELIEEK